MKLPKRIPQHISETASFKLFSSKIPNNWIIRDITERDYGIDCYLELVNDNDELSGELALIQLKSKQSILWTKKDTYTLSGINISTSNYWYKFPVPVFIFLVDLEDEKVYFKSVGYSIKRNFSDFVKQKSFSYSFKRSDEFEGKDGVFAFKFQYYYENSRQQFENELLFFLSNLQHFKDFQFQHNNKDFHLGIEDTDIIYFEALHRNYRFLCIYFNIGIPIPSLKLMKKKSQEKFRNELHYELYEQDLTEWVEEFEKLTVEIVRKMKSYVNGELSYWLITNPTVYNFVINLKED